MIIFGYKEENLLASGLYGKRILATGLPQDWTDWERKIKLFLIFISICLNPRNPEAEIILIRGNRRDPEAKILIREL